MVRFDGHHSQACFLLLFCMYESLTVCTGILNKIQVLYSDRVSFYSLLHSFNIMVLWFLYYTLPGLRCQGLWKILRRFHLNFTDFMWGKDWHGVLLEHNIFIYLGFLGFLLESSCTSFLRFISIFLDIKFYCILLKVTFCYSCSWLELYLIFNNLDEFSLF